MQLLCDDEQGMREESGRLRQLQAKMAIPPKRRKEADKSDESKSLFRRRRVSRLSNRIICHDTGEEIFSTESDREKQKCFFPGKVNCSRGGKNNFSWQKCPPLSLLSQARIHHSHTHILCMETFEATFAAAAAHVAFPSLRQLQHLLLSSRSE